MPRRRRYVSLNVFLNSRLVGQLNRETSGAINFRYDPTWLDWEHTLPDSLSLPLREDHFIGAPVLAFFDNLLPDGDPLRRQIATRVHAEGIDAYSLLSAVGRDCVGALQFLPEGIEPGPAGAVEGNPVKRGPRQGTRFKRHQPQPPRGRDRILHIEILERSRGARDLLRGRRRNDRSRCCPPLQPFCETFPIGKGFILTLANLIEPVGVPFHGQPRPDVARAQVRLRVPSGSFRPQVACPHNGMYPKAFPA
jgi:HipA-like protein